MFNSRIKHKFRKGRNARFYQGDILKDLDFVVGDPKKETYKDKVYLLYAVILSQDCDIKSDFSSRKLGKEHNSYLQSLLVCPAYRLEDFARGDHIDGWKMKTFSKKEIDKLKNNDEYKRYHYLSKKIEYSISSELVLDFKHYFTLPRGFLYKQRKNIYLASLSELFREELSQRFSNYLSRIGLPEVN